MHSGASWPPLSLLSGLVLATAIVKWTRVVIYSSIPLLYLFDRHHPFECRFYWEMGCENRFKNRIVFPISYCNYSNVVILVTCCCCFCCQKSHYLERVTPDAQGNVIGRKSLSRNLFSRNTFLSQEERDRKVFFFKIRLLLLKPSSPSGPLFPFFL